jgi:hypothetical protein
VAIRDSLYSKQLTDGAHVCSLVVGRTTQNDGWIVREALDEQVVKEVTYHDWHRVELAIEGFSAETSRLKREGWRDG